jgi:hypothetical protein
MNALPSQSNNNIEWYQKMIDAYNNLLSADEKKDLAEWEKQNLGETEKATSDWPGWVKFIGLPPWKVISN